jgi:alcohol dehydrogenase class IV
MFDFSLKTKVKFGQGVRKYIINALKMENWRHIGIVYDHNLIQNKVIAELLDSIIEASSTSIKTNL